MALIDKVRWSLLPVLAIAALASCGPRVREPAQPAGSSAPFQPVAAPDPSPPKSADTAGSLPSLVVAGEVAAFKATSANATTQQDRDAAGSLPSNVAAGKSAVYAPGGREPPASRAPPARIAQP